MKNDFQLLKLRSRPFQAVTSSLSNADWQKFGSGDFWSKAISPTDIFTTMFGQPSHTALYCGTILYMFCLEFWVTIFVRIPVANVIKLISTQLRRYWHNLS
jgi:hypothetical protein